MYMAYVVMNIYSRVFFTVDSDQPKRTVGKQSWNNKLISSDFP